MVFASGSFLARIVYVAIRREFGNLILRTLNSVSQKINSLSFFLLGHFVLFVRYFE